MFALNLAGDGRILSATFPEYASEEAVTVDRLPDGNIADYLFIEGEYVYDPIPEPEPGPTPEKRIAELEAALAALIGGDTDE